jgi:DUF1365 family protein
LPYDKETIRSAIDRCIEYLIEQHGGVDVPATPELEERINTLGEAKWTLFNFGDPQDREAVDMLNSCSAMLRPASVDETDWFEFIRWDIKISRKYGRRVKTEIERLAWR